MNELDGIEEGLVRAAKDLNVYRLAYSTSMEIFEITKRFPPEERYVLTSQIRRSSRSICLNLREAWAKRRYEAHFIAKLTDCDGETAETDSSLDYARDCGYISEDEHQRLSQNCERIGAMLGKMIRNAHSFTIG